MKKIICIVGILAVVFVSAQNIMILSGNVNRIMMHPSSVVDSTEIGRANLLVKYRFMKKDPMINNHNGILRCDIRVLIGNNTVMQTDLCLYYDHLIHTRMSPDTLLSKLRNKAGIQPSNLFSDIIHDRKSNIMTTRCGDYFHSDVMVSYSQPAPELHWDVVPDQKEIGQYKCKKAVVKYGGRVWTVWFTEELPVSVGPWMLNGLPGLILEASDNGDFSFTCTEIKGDIDIPIMKCQFRSERSLKSKRDYFKYEKNSFEHPFQTFANGQQAIVATKNIDGKLIYLDDSWTIPYNPIELE